MVFHSISTSVEIALGADFLNEPLGQDFAAHGAARQSTQFCHLVPTHTAGARGRGPFGDSRAHAPLQQTSDGDLRAAPSGRANGSGQAAAPARIYLRGA